MTNNYNREYDVKLDIKVQMFNLSTSLDLNQRIDSLMMCHDYYHNYDNKPAYTWIPMRAERYNSNSYAVGLLDAAKIDDLEEPAYRVPGYENKLPAIYFGVDE